MRGMLIGEDDETDDFIFKIIVILLKHNYQDDKKYDV